MKDRKQKGIDELNELKKQAAESKRKNDLATEKLIAACWHEIDSDIEMLIKNGEDPLYILKVLLNIVRDKKENEA